MTVELYGMASCPYTTDLREWLELRGIPFTEYDVDTDVGARDRLRALPGAPRIVPVMVENGNVKQVGWAGRGCAIPE